MAVDTAALRQQVLALQFRGSADAPPLAHELVSAVESESGEGSLAMADALDQLASTYLGPGM